MITDKQREWLQDIMDGKITKKDDPHKWSVYMKRIRERIDNQMDNGVWLCVNMPEIMRDEEWEIQEIGAIKRRRFKILLQMIKCLYPEYDVELFRAMREVGLNPMTEA